MKKSVDARFDEKVEPVDNGCHLWRSAIGSRGYGIFWIGGTKRSMFAHRFAFERSKGTIPVGKLLMHSCDTPACVNPEHLSVGDHQSNALDAQMKGRLAVGERNGGGKKLTQAQALEIRQSELGCSLLARQYGVSSQTIKAIRRGRIWRCAGGL